MLVVISFECIFKFFNWSRLVELPGSDEMKIFYTEHDFQVDLENSRLQLKISCRENTTIYCQHRLLIIMLIPCQGHLMSRSSHA